MSKKSYATALEDSLDEVESIEDFCKDWKTKWRPVAIAVQSLLAVFYPVGAKVLQQLINIGDGACGVSVKRNE